MNVGVSRRTLNPFMTPEMETEGRFDFVVRNRRLWLMKDQPRYVLRFQSLVGIEQPLQK